MQGKTGQKNKSGVCNSLQFNASHCKHRVYTKMAWKDKNNPLFPRRKPLFLTKAVQNPVQMPIVQPHVMGSKNKNVKQVYVRQFNLESVDPKAWCQLVSHGQSTLYINNRVVGHANAHAIDPVKWPRYKSFMPLAKEMVIGNYLKSGKNTIKVTVESPDKKPSFALALGWQDKYQRNVLTSDASWKSSLEDGVLQSAKDYGPFATRNNSGIKNNSDLYPLLVPRAWDDKKYEIYPVDSFPVVEHQNGLLKPRIVNGLWSVKQFDHRWYMVDPNHQPFFMLASQTDMVLPRWAYRYSKYLFNAFDNELQWAEHDAKMIKQMGFNTLAVSMHDTMYQEGQNIGMSSFRNLDISFKTGGPKLKNNKNHSHHMPDPFDKFWQKRLTSYLEKLVQDWEGQSVVGVFADNEIPLDGALHMHTIVGSVYSKAAGQEFIHWLESQYENINVLNKSWYQDEKQKYHQSFEAILKDKPSPYLEPKKGMNYVRKSPGKDTPKIYKDFYAFGVILTRKYASYILKEIRRVMPDKLAASNRFMGGATREILEAWQDYDIIAWNAYPMDRWGKGTFTDVQVQRIKFAYQVTGKPMIISEFGTQGLDTNVPSPTAKLATQKRRGQEYVKIVNQIVKEFPYVVGIVPFSWMDSTEGERSNWGIINPQGQPYIDNIKIMAKQHHALNQILQKPY